MQPLARCPRCGQQRLFHESELESLRKGTVVCLECSLEKQEVGFLVEVLRGEHKEAVDRMKEALQEEQMKKDD